MSSESSEDRVEDASSEASADMETAGAGARTAPRRRPSAVRPSTRRRGKSAPKVEEPTQDDAGEHLREQVASVLAATRERIVKQPVQAVLVAAAAGALAALLLGAGRR